MTYIEVVITHGGTFDAEILIAYLAELGFESFSESDQALYAYIRSDACPEGPLNELLDRIRADYGLTSTVNTIQPENWNALWEKSYEPVLISDECMVRAPFHQPVEGIQYDIIIEPKMSFGTAHHETTYLMLNLLLKEELVDLSVLDMGCGTGVLSILASMKGASRVVAIDNDQWAWQNAVENCERNGGRPIQVILGDATGIPDETFDLILANINRNVLVADMQNYIDHLNSDGRLLLSGFYEEDLESIHAAAVEKGLTLSGYAVRNKWIGAKYIK
jgi:ribosomal protein L11 methyltransferase